MRSIRSCFSVLALAVLAACGGGSHAAVVPPATATDAGERSVSGSTVAYEDHTLWACIDYAGLAYSSHQNGNATPLRIIQPRWVPQSGSDISVIQDCGAAPDGTMWFLLGNDAIFGSTTWRLLAYAPGETNGANYENAYDGDGAPVSFALAGNGVIVEAANVSTQVHTVRMYPYGANDPQPIRSLVLPLGQSGVSINNDDKLFVGAGAGYAVYKPTDTGWTPKRTVAFTTPVSGPLAVGPDNTVYVFDTSARLTARYTSGYLYAFTGGSNTPARRIGPIQMHFSGVETSSGDAITVDSLGRPYVLSAGVVYRYAPNADGNATPQRSINLSTSYARGLAIGP